PADLKANLNRRKTVDSLGRYRRLRPSRAPRGSAALARGALPSDIVAVVRSRATVADFAARGVQVREADYSEPDSMRAALAGVNRLLLVSSSEAGQRVVHHTNVIDAAKAVRVSRILYTSMLKTDAATNPFSADHLAIELALRE